MNESISEEDDSDDDPMNHSMKHCRILHPFQILTYKICLMMKSRKILSLVLWILAATVRHGMEKVAVYNFPSQKLRMFDPVVGHCLTQS